MQLVEIVSKPVLSLYNGTNEGTVLSANFSVDLKRLKSLIILTESPTKENEEELYLDAKKVYSFGDNAITIRNNSALELLTSRDGTITNNNPINSIAYTVKGHKIGKITDVCIDEKLNVTHLVVTDIQLPIKLLASYSENTVIFYEEQINCNVKRMRPVFARPKILENSENIVRIMNDNIDRLEMTEPSEEKLSETPTKKYTLNEQEGIIRLNTNSSLLIGKKVTKTIQTQNGELIAKKNTIITPKIVSLVTTHRKLRELAMYSE